MKRNIFKIIVIIIVIIGGIKILDSINHFINSPSKEFSYHENLMTVEEIEKSKPTNFLTADGTYTENLWRDKIKINGKIKNSATVAIYKDAVIRVTFYSKTKTILKSEDYIIYEIFPPHSTKNFELKINNFKNVNSIGWDVISATPY